MQTAPRSRPLKLILFDLDDTLLPTSSLRDHRHSKKAVDLTHLDEFQSALPYKGVVPALHAISMKVRIGMVTSSPRWYVEQILEWHFEGIQFDPLVTYNDVSNLKPHPEPLCLAMRLAKEIPEGVYYVGNASDDHQACIAADALFIGAGWSDVKSYHTSMVLECETPGMLINLLEPEF